MNVRIFKEANRLIEQKKVKWIGFGITRDIAYFEVAGVKVDIETIDHKTTFTCRCKHHSNNHDSGLLCSYTIAAIKYMCKYYEKKQTIKTRDGKLQNVFQDK